MLSLMSIQTVRTGLAAVCALAALAPSAGRSLEIDAGLVEARLVSEVASIRPGTPFWVAIRFDIQETWHINWKNPGDAGLPPAVTWDLPEGFHAGELLWPAPQRYPAGPLTIFGYAGRVHLLAEITPPADLETGGTATIRAGVDWLACQAACVPGDARVALTLPIADDVPAWNQSARRAFTESRARMPGTRTTWTFAAFLSADELVLTADSAAGVGEVSSVFFYPEDGGLIEHSAEQTWNRNGDDCSLRIARAALPTAPPERLRGVVVAKTETGTAVIDVDCPLEKR